jgi:hypothetical protein
MAYPDSSPVVQAELQDINVAIRLERDRLWDIEEKTGSEPGGHYLEYLNRAKARGVAQIVINF